jgi:hypothetical protein
MQEWGKRGTRAEMRALVVEASEALARLNADRLEELALSCQLLNRNLVNGTPESRAELTRQARDAREKMAVLARLLEVTRANLSVMTRLKELREVRLEYRAAGSSCWNSAENRHGDN